MKIASTEVQDPVIYDCKIEKHLGGAMIVVKISPQIYGPRFNRQKDIDVLVLEPRYSSDSFWQQLLKLPMIVNVFLPERGATIEEGPWEHVDIAEITP